MMKAKRMKMPQQAKPAMPKGFDITLVDLLLKYDFDQERLDKFRDMHKDKKGSLVWAQFGRQFYYRESQVVDIFKLEVKSHGK